MVHACTIAIVHACTIDIVHACTVAIVHACTIAIVHACTIAIVLVVHASCSVRFRTGSLGGEAPQGSREVWGAAGLPIARRDVPLSSVTSVEFACYTNGFY